MPVTFLAQAFYQLFVVVEIILMVYLISTWISLPAKINQLLVTLILPILIPMRFLLRHSIFYIRNVDISPIIALTVIAFLQNLCYGLFAT